MSPMLQFHGFRSLQTPHLASEMTNWPIRGLCDFEGMLYRGEVARRDEHPRVDGRNCATLSHGNPICRRCPRQRMSTHPQASLATSAVNLENDTVTGEGKSRATGFLQDTWVRPNKEIQISSVTTTKSVHLSSKALYLNWQP